MKLKFSKGSLIALVLVFGISGLEGLLRHLGLTDVADFLRDNVDLLADMSASKVVTLLMAYLGAQQSLPVVQTKPVIQMK